MRWVMFVALATACGGTGSWDVQTWGEDYIEQGIPAEAFADGCSVHYDEFLVVMGATQLLDGDGDVVGDLGGARVFDMTVPGPSDMGSADVPADHYSRVRVLIAPDTAATAGTASEAQVTEMTGLGASVLADGTLTCGGSDAHFRWSFDASTTYDCEPPDLTLPAGGSDDTQITVHGDHLFYDDLEAADAALRGQEAFDADTDGDGEITLEELDAVSVPVLGFGVGEYSNVLTLRQFVAHLSRTIVHIDGEGECRVDF